MEWNKAPADLKLASSYVDVWRSEIKLSESEIDAYAETLSVEEKKRASRFTFTDKQNEFIVSRGLLRRALSHLLKRPANSFEFAYSKEKKPFLKNTNLNETPVFNVSHSHGQALIAISRNRQLGIDIEKIREDVEYKKLAQRFFSKNENRALLAYQGNVQRAFFATWTRKEAFVKAIGKGIAFGLGEFDVNTDPDTAPELLETRNQAIDVKNWRMASVATADDYIASVAADAGEFSLRLWEFS